MSLAEQTFCNLTRLLLQQADILNRCRHDIAKFEELCAVLRAHGINFAELLDVDDHEVNYYITPAHHGDYLELIETLSAMGAFRTRISDVCEIVNIEPESPTFWLRSAAIN
ncbi:MAG: hypothetical protein WC742_12475 [Gallionellaceae bacterium]|jgi:hypothetical protein